jgi:hypothetical protein
MPDLISVLCDWIAYARRCNVAFPQAITHITDAILRGVVPNLIYAARDCTTANSWSTKRGFRRTTHIRTAKLALRRRRLLPRHMEKSKAPIAILALIRPHDRH